MNRLVYGVFLAGLLVPASPRGADPAPVMPAALARSPTGSPGGGVSSPEVERAEIGLKESEMRVREAQQEVSRRMGEVQEARMRLDLARTGAQVEALKAQGTRESRRRAKALAERAKALKTIIDEDLPEIRALEARQEAARQAEDTAGMVAIQQALASRRRTVARRQIEGDLAVAKMEQNTQRVRMFEQRLAEIARQEKAGPAVPGRPPPRK